MKILFIFRKKTNARFSLESVFQSIGFSLESQGHEVSYFYVNNFFDLLRLSKIDCDIAHITGDINYVAFLFLNSKKVLSIHDVGHLMSLRGIKKYIYKKIWFDLPIIFSKKVIFSSNSTVINAKSHNVSTKDALVMPLTSLNLFFDIGHNKKFSSSQRLLHVGTQENKNLIGSIKIASKLNQSLTVIGAPSLKEEKFAKDLNVRLLTYTNINKDELLSIYKQHTVLIFPSFHEGFGLPIIEAQAAGLLVITSNLAPMNEVAGVNSSILVDPFRLDKSIDSILSIINDEKRFKSLLKRGYKNALNYDSLRVSQKYINLYSSMTS